MSAFAMFVNASVAARRGIRAAAAGSVFAGFGHLRLRYREANGALENFMVLPVIAD
jgi:hypothetical protein